MPVTGRCSASTRLLKAEGKNPFTLDSKEPTASYVDFIKSETRYSRLALAFPERADMPLSARLEKNAKAKYERLKKLVTLYAPDDQETK